MQQINNLAIYPLFINCLPVYMQIANVRYYAYVRKRKAFQGLAVPELKKYSGELLEKPFYEVLFKKDKVLTPLKETFNIADKNILLTIPLKALLTQPISALVEYPFDMDKAFNVSGIENERLYIDEDIIYNPVIETDEADIHLSSITYDSFDMSKIFEEVLDKCNVSDFYDYKSLPDERKQFMAEITVKICSQALDKINFTLTQEDGNSTVDIPELPEARCLHDKELNSINIFTPQFVEIMDRFRGETELGDKYVFTYQYYLGYASVMQQEYRNSIGNIRTLTGTVPDPSAYGEGFKLIASVNEAMLPGTFIYRYNQYVSKVIRPVTLQGNFSCNENGTELSLLQEDVIYEEYPKNVATHITSVYKLYTDSDFILSALDAFMQLYLSGYVVNSDSSYMSNLMSFKDKDTLFKTIPTDIFNLITLSQELYYRLSNNNRQYRITGLTFLNLYMLSHYIVNKNDLRDKDISHINHKKYKVYMAVGDKDVPDAVTTCTPFTSEKIENSYSLMVLNETAYTLLKNVAYTTKSDFTYICNFASKFKYLLPDFSEQNVLYNNYHSYMASKDIRMEMHVITLRTLDSYAKSSLYPSNNDDSSNHKKAYLFPLKLNDIYALLSAGQECEISETSQEDLLSVILNNTKVELWSARLKSILEELSIMERS